MTMDGEMWAFRVTPNAFQIWTENGRFVGQFIDRVIAEDVIDDHNLGVEMDRPEPPDVVKSRAQKQAERLAAWRKDDPSGARAVELLIEAGARLGCLISLKAPNIIITHAIDSLTERVEMLKALYPEIDYGAEES